MRSSSRSSKGRFWFKRALKARVIKWWTHCFKQFVKFRNLHFFTRVLFQCYLFIRDCHRYPLNINLGIYSLTWCCEKTRKKTSFGKELWFSQIKSKNSKTHLSNYSSPILCFVKTGLQILWCFWNDRNQQFSDFDLFSKPILHIRKALRGFFICIFSSLTCLKKPVFSKWDLLCWKVPASLSLFLKSEKIPALLY
jgi:hypothetical protein